MRSSCYLLTLTLLSVPKKMAGMLTHVHICDNPRAQLGRVRVDLDWIVCLGFFSVLVWLPTWLLSISSAPPHPLHFISSIFSRIPCPPLHSILSEDPLVETVFDDLDDKDKDEFEGFGKARKKKRHKRAMWEAVEESGPAKRRRLSIMCIKLRKPKATPKAKAKAAAVPPVPAAAAAAAAAAALAAPAAALAVAPEPEAPAPAMPLAPAVAVLVPQPPAPVPIAHPRGPNVFIPCHWEDMTCQQCGQVNAQKKYHPSPGGRDGPTWTFRCYATIH